MGLIQVNCVKNSNLMIH